MNAVVRIVVAVKSTMVVSVALLALVAPTSSATPVQRDVQQPATLDVVTSDDARTCYAMGGRLVGNEICKDVDY